MINNDHIPDDPAASTTSGWEILLRAFVFLAAFAFVCALAFFWAGPDEVVASSSDLSAKSPVETPPPTE